MNDDSDSATTGPGRSAWLDDVKWFWEGVADDSSKLVDGVRNRRTQT